VAVGGARIEFPLSAAVGGPCAYARLGVGVAGARTGRFFLFSSFFRKIFINIPLAVSIQKIDPYLGTVVIGTELTHFCASEFGAKVLG
jgi:hypothetical protein